MTKAREIIVDLFAGGGGASSGIEQALGVPIDIAVNHDPYAIAMHLANHSHTKHFTEDAFELDPRTAVGARSVGLLWASPDCAHYSKAKGGKPVDKKIRGLAWIVIRWAVAVRPRIIILENVSEFRKWGPLDSDNRPLPEKRGTIFCLWANRLRGLGYRVEFRELSACDYGAPTTRKRLFMVARCDGEPIVWPSPTHAEPGNSMGLPVWRTAAECLDWSLPCPSIFDTAEEIKRKYGVRAIRPLAENTLRRIAMGVQRYVLQHPEPFILTNTTGHAPHSVREPLATVTTGGHHALVAPFLSKYFGGVAGADVRRPTPTVTAIDHNALISTYLTKFYSTNIGSDVRKPVPTITATGQHLAEVRAFLIKYYGCARGQSQDARKPMHTVPAKSRFGLVTVAGQRYRIADIGLRMLVPRELARAQGFSEGYVLTGTKANQVAKIGNSVCPPVARALVAANVRLRTKIRAAG